MAYLYLKALHVIFVVCWFAGLFYIVRLFVYYVEANEKPQLEQDILKKQYRLMTNRLWNIITWPAAVLTLVFGISLFVLNPLLLQQPWMHVKLLFVILLIAYHLKCHQFVKQINRNTLTKTSSFFRLWNEGATIILFSVVFLVFLKNAFNWIFGVVGLIALAILLMLGIKLYKGRRQRNMNE
ncbi:MULTISPECIES: CopD family protein [unclassified Myroides]|uniref:CopD family protein n=1 Tax=unclassified Myroides TaxID=2642485 RepID=UPI0015F830A3|nr:MULTISPECIES: CopD family protein [unclassified Myroides]MBB1151042.1 CopD family protein [Myroides sp. NP-2]MDM1407893.1 CopD family protein [Myroides sp. DF42-4-2]